MVHNSTILSAHAPKPYQVLGTLNIAASLPSHLSFFIILSSLVGIVGNNGQANYASARTFQDAFARSRTARGMPTQSIDVGIIADAGYVAENKDIYRHATAQVFRPIPVAELTAVLDYTFSTPIKDIDDCQLMIGLTDPGRETQAVNFSDAKFEHVRTGVAVKTGAVSLHSRLQSTASRAEMQGVVCEAIIAQVAKVLVIPIEDIHASQSTSYYGGDALSAVELRSWMARALDAQVGGDGEIEWEEH